MEQVQLLKRIRIWILCYLQFRQLIWRVLASIVGEFFIDPGNYA